MRGNKKTKIAILIFGILLIGIGYAYLTANLKITGTAKISNSKWDIHFENPGYSSSSTVTFPSNSNSNVDPGIPVIKGEDRQELEWTAIFNEPGNYYDFHADIVNDGDITADIDYANSFLTLKYDDNEVTAPLSNFTYWYKGDDIYNDNSGFESNTIPDYLDFTVMYRGLSLEPGESGYLSCSLEILPWNISDEEWENIRGKELKMNLNLKYKQSDGNVEYNGTKIRVERPTINTLGTNSSVMPKITNQAVNLYDQHKIEYDVVFNNPGDFYEFTVDLKNYSEQAGYVYLEDRTIKIGDGEEIDFYNINNLPEGLVYDRGEFDSYFIVCENSTRKVTIRLGLDPNISTEKLNELKGIHIKIYTRLQSGSELGSGNIEKCDGN